jgi:hypothetical protein
MSKKKELTPTSEAYTYLVVTEEFRIHCSGRAAAYRLAEALHGCHYDGGSYTRGMPTLLHSVTVECKHILSEDWSELSYDAQQEYKDERGVRSFEAYLSAMARARTSLNPEEEIG